MNWKTFHQQFTLYPVGQGLFYSCTIKRQEKVVFRMVFDCGSKTKGAGQEEVDVYRDTDFLNEETLDLLIISHFDSDHVNYIGKLLDGGIKIKRLVMPFISFEEKLYLTLKMLEEANGYNSELDYTTRLILDPLTTLAGNLDTGFEAYLMESDPENPISPDNNNEGIEIENRDDRRTVFVFPSKAKEDITGTTYINAKTKGKVFKVKDSVKGSAADAQSKILLMDFLFYKKSIGNKEKTFYKKVKELFLKQQKINGSLKEEKLLEAVSEKIKAISSSTKIVEVFNKAAKEIGIPQKEVSNLNTTALCMLHRNLQNIIDYVAEERFDNDKFYKFWNPGFYHIQKFLTDKSSRIVKTNYFPFFMDDLPFFKNRFREHEFFRFPNVLLTSDCFLLEKKEVKAFLEKYTHYFSDFWLFQIPHHGSKENSDAVLHSNIPIKSCCFINYGTNNTHKHPSCEVIESLVVSGLSINLFPVSEFQGIKFDLNLQISKK